MSATFYSAIAANQPINAKLRSAESAYQMAITVFGIDSAEAQAALCYWQALRRKCQAGFSAWT